MTSLLWLKLNLSLLSPLFSKWIPSISMDERGHRFTMLLIALTKTVFSARVGNIDKKAILISEQRLSSSLTCWHIWLNMRTDCWTVCGIYALDACFCNRALDTRFISNFNHSKRSYIFGEHSPLFIVLTMEILFNRQTNNWILFELKSNLSGIWFASAQATNNNAP